MHRDVVIIKFNANPAITIPENNPLEIKITYVKINPR
jgi:hypothetical protein